MKKIELTSYEANDLVRILQYAIDKKKEDFENGKMNRKKLIMEIDDIRCILARIPKEYIRKEHITKIEKTFKTLNEGQDESVINIFE